ncbi:MAG: putative toxin-antitoxin system toxin component, PIN family [Nanoarchaeota archaeon]|nr:putative toxin-antitoxin system toxin component, PIN family [Nanoarchaeota archaeon]MBU1005685.1 putative toxin-antitoxin system toxin component, PIN family [Nanoarchaeota archaeon]MBU1946176.1 putative toxin-antitoxin system toxin component, PIN family [Nanoarchaeota archaeon]
MGKKKIVIDTNTLISAFGWGGKPFEIVSRVIGGKYELILSLKQMEEFIRVLDYPKFGFTDEQKERFYLLLFGISTVIKTKTKLEGISRDAKDDTLLEPAKDMKIDYIITGDKDLLVLKEFESAKIVAASQFLEENP